MSEDNNPSKAAVSVLDTLKSNPKALYAAIGAAVVVVLILAMSGGGEEMQITTAVTVGQQVTLDNPNGGGSHLTVVPGLMSTSEAEDDQDQSVCVTKAGTKATVEEEMVVGQLPFVKVKVLDGDCQGKSGWTSKVNVKGG
ncbi:uncharacterized protein sS8_0628 [Methylocaldum marinum]|uniref:Uncharacterized protein n=1 Tax=Methylocaldum marinum TaxID=1432792 RepID=A0A250KLN8_9GAMM|nr:hypothetical protein [Methylocaldum marinum]BBA32593.1 uncharacterized protein sS8_0628 [Methylocaldum marinum]